MRSEPSAWLIGTLIVIGDRAASVTGYGLLWRYAVIASLILALIAVRNSAK